MEQMTFKEYQDRNKAAIAEMLGHADLDDSPYGDRDTAVARLDDKWFEACGLFPTTPLTIFTMNDVRWSDKFWNECPDCSSDKKESSTCTHAWHSAKQLEDLVKDIPGMTLYVGEENMEVFKDGKSIATSWLSCRGSQWYGEYTFPDGKLYRASDTHPEFQEGSVFSNRAS